MMHHRLLFLVAFFTSVLFAGAPAHAVAVLAAECGLDGSAASSFECAAIRRGSLWRGLL